MTSFNLSYVIKGFPGRASGKEPDYQCRSHESSGFNPWAGASPEAGNIIPKYATLIF